MRIRRYTHPLPLLLLSMAGAAHAACDERKLHEPDTRAVEAAARQSTGAQLHDFKVQQACIVGTTTSVTLVSARRAEESWEITCIRLQSTWSRRGGWKC